MRNRVGTAFWFALAISTFGAVSDRQAACQTQQPKMTAQPHNVYVAPFFSKDSISPKLLDSFRDLFEESFERTFSRDGNYVVLNRETVEKVLAEAKYEAALTSVEQLSSASKSRLRVVNAEGFVFGEVTDDKDSGEIVISAKLQSFDSVLHWNESVTMRRGQINDRSDRKDAMEKLVHSISEIAPMAAAPGPQQNLSGRIADSPTGLFKGSSTQETLRLCEEPVPNPSLMGDCGFLTWTGSQYNATWEGWTLLAERDFPNRPGRLKSPPSSGTVKAERDGAHGVVLRRADVTGITCTYNGSIETNVASGTYVCDLQGKTLTSGPWKLVPKP